MEVDRVKLRQQYHKSITCIYIIVLMGVVCSCLSVYIRDQVEAFVEFLTSGQPHSPRYFLHSVRQNLVSGVKWRCFALVYVLPCNDLSTEKYRSC